MAATVTRKQRPSRQSGTTAPPVTKTADSKGRIALGGDFANKPVLIERLNDPEVLVKMARVIPESEAWLYDNTVALDSVRKGLKQARAVEFVEGPDLDADTAFAAELEG
jgi:hypothetical protein